LHKFVVRFFENGPPGLQGTKSPVSAVSGECLPAYHYHRQPMTWIVQRRHVRGSKN